MSRIKPSIPKGTRDFSSAVMFRRNFIFETVKKAFERYGYAPIQTPAMENMETLTGKYGEEGDRLIFKILNSGDYLSKADINEKTTSKSLTIKFILSKYKAVTNLRLSSFSNVLNSNKLLYPF